MYSTIGSKFKYRSFFPNFTYANSFMHNRVLVLAVFVVASCGLAYELIAGALSSYLLGDSILQFSSIIGCYLFAMGLGAHASRFVPDDVLIERFIDVELLIALLGGISASLLFFVFAQSGASFRSVLYVIVFLIGAMVGMEIPLVMRVLNARQAAFKDIVSRVLTFDYLGALAVSLTFPLVLAPKLGLARTAFLFGLLNASVALWMIALFRAELRSPQNSQFKAGLVVCVMLFGLAFSDRLMQWNERQLFSDEVIHAQTTPYQRIVVTRWKNDLRLHLNGNLQFSSRDEHRYHEALVHPIMQNLSGARRVLVLGGGDGLAVRELLKYPNIQNITLVDLDAGMTRLFSTSAELVALNANALNHPKVTVVNADAMQWLESQINTYDAAIVDFPDPSNFSLGKLYSVPFYRLLARHITPLGLIVIQSTSPYFAPNAFWSINATLIEAGLKTWPYHVYVPSFGEWGFIAASAKGDLLIPTQYSVETQFLDEANTAAMFQFPKDMAPRAVEPNFLNSQPLVRYFEQDWKAAIR
jgi:spermidine synthase